MKILRFLLLALLPLPVAAQEVTSGTGALVRALDKITGELADIEIRSGVSATFGRMTIELSDCRYPTGDPTGNAYAQLRIIDEDGAEAFAGWMVADSPALNALDHPRYDIWVLRCSE